MRPPGPKQLSVVIATKNRPDDLYATVTTLLSQTRLPEEIIIIDQSDADESHRRVLEQCAVRNGFELVYVHDKTISGASAARNAGIRLADGDLILFLDDDVLLEAEFVREILAACQRDPGLDGVCGIVTNYRMPSWTTRLALRTFWIGPFQDERQPIYWHADALRARALIPVRKFGTGAMAIRRSALKGVWFDEALRGLVPGEDVDFCCRLGAKARLFVAPRARYVHKRSGVNRSREHWLGPESESAWYLFLRNWNRGLINRLCFGWLNIGLALLAVASTVRRRSAVPSLALARGIGQGIRHVIEGRR